MKDHSCGLWVSVDTKHDKVGCRVQVGRDILAPVGDEIRRSAHRQAPEVLAVVQVLAPLSLKLPPAPPDTRTMQNSALLCCSKLQHPLKQPVLSSQTSFG